MTELNKTTTEKFLPKLKAVLTADQFTRLQQINWQAMGAAALSEPEIVKALPISTEQQNKIKALSSDFDTKQRELFTAAFSGGGGGDREAMQENMQTLAKERETKTLEVLTADQKTKFDTLKGKAFDVTKLRGGFGGGRGGPGGRPAGARPATEDKKAE